MVPANPLCHPDPETLTAAIIAAWHRREADLVPGYDQREQLAHAEQIEALGPGGTPWRPGLLAAVAYHRAQGAPYPDGWGTWPRGEFHRAAAAVLIAQGRARFRRGGAYG
jgi:hypothetical protein